MINNNTFITYIVQIKCAYDQMHIDFQRRNGISGPPPGHHGLEDVSIQLIDRVSGEESALRDKEGQWAYRLNCIQPQGLNISDFFYSQNRATRSRVR